MHVTQCITTCYAAFTLAGYRPDSTWIDHIPTRVTPCGHTARSIVGSGTSAIAACDRQRLVAEAVWLFWSFPKGEFFASMRPCIDASID